MEFSPDRVECAQFIASTFTGKTNSCAPSFVTGNVYDLARILTEPFDVVLALGGLYHIADPPYVLTQIRSLTRERLIVQTHNVLNKLVIGGRSLSARTRLLVDLLALSAVAACGISA